MNLPALYRVLSLCCALVATSGLHAQTDVRNLSADELCRTALKIGDQIVVTGKYKELIDEELYLFDCGLPLRLESQRLFGQLLNFTPKEDNITVVGVVGSLRGERVIHVRDLKAAPGDFAIFHEEFKALGSTRTEQRADRLVRLGRRVLQATKRRQDRRLLALARQIFRDALELETEHLDSEGITKRIERVRKVHTWLQDHAFARDLIVPLLEASPGNKSVVQFLRELGCRKYDERWVTHDEYKRLEGLVEHEGEWTTPRELHHRLALDQFKQLPKSNLPLLRRRTEKEYVLVAEDGRVETGMRREEVCLALGFPDFVLRRAHRRKEFDQWSYGNKYYYFYDGILVFLPNTR